MFYDEAQSTMFTVLDHAVHGDLEDRNRALAFFCESYSDPLVDFLCYSKRIDRSEAEEVVQSFWSERFFAADGTSKFLHKFLEKKQENSAISLRKYLARSIVLHFISSRRPRSGQAISLDGLEGWEPVAEPEQQDFDVIWANRMLARVLEKVRLECTTQDQLQYWSIFEEQALWPAIHGLQPPGYAALAEKYGLRSPKAASNAMQTMIRKFHRAFAAVVQEYAPAVDGSPSSSDGVRSQANEELTALFGLLTQPGNLLLKPMESDSDWSFGFQLGANRDPTALLRLDHIDQAANLYNSSSDLSQAWQDLCEARLQEWLPVTEASIRNSRLNDVIHGGTSMGACDAVRSGAKQLARGDADRDLPQVFLAAAYLLAIAAAQVRLGAAISTQDASSLKRRVIDLLEHPWLRDSERELLRAYAANLERAPGC